MCGIFFYAEKNKKIGNSILTNIIKLSEKRGLDNLGICFKNENLDIIKSNVFNDRIYKTKIFRESLLKTNDYIFGQCRLVTDGPRFKPEYNQPIVTKKIVGTHNGIILDYLNDNYSENINSENDTRNFYDEISNLNFSNINELEKFINTKKGIINIIFYNRQNNQTYFYSNNGSLYFYVDDNRIIASSEKYFLDKLKDKFNLNGAINKIKINKLLCFDNQKFIISDIENKKFHKTINLIDHIFNNDERIKLLKKCIKCVLPETYPLIKFDQYGVCNYCNTHIKQKFLGDEALKKKIGDKNTKILFGLSGGRDSCYALYYLYEVLGYKNIITYTYDWGLTTDYARRNISYFCQKYGIENIIRAPNIYKKRKYISQNLRAWLKRPHLGMVPLFFIGDKPFLYYGSELRKKTKSDITIFGSGFQCEKMEFKVGYCGINQNIQNNIRMYNFDLLNKFKLLLWYSLQYIKNPFYINSSLLDNIIGFYSSFIHKDSAIYIYNYVKYPSHNIDSVLRNLGFISDKKYGVNQWRVGDGHTALTNFIYYQIGGFSEFDNYRSNQVREGIITREEAVKLVEIDNQTRLDTISNFCNLIGVNTEEILLKILNIKKRY